MFRNEVRFNNVSDQMASSQSSDTERMGVFCKVMVKLILSTKYR